MDGWEVCPKAARSSHLALQSQPRRCGDPPLASYLWWQKGGIVCQLPLAMPSFYSSNLLLVPAPSAAHTSY